MIEKRLNKKTLYRRFEIFINELVNKGYLFYFITINDTEFNTEDLNKKKEKVYFYTSTIEEIGMIDYLIFSPELNKKGVLHLHYIICVKSIIGFNNKLGQNILEYLINKTYQEDIVIKEIFGFIDLKKTFNYCFKNLGKQVIEDRILDNLYYGKGYFDRDLNKKDTFSKICHKILRLDEVVYDSFEQLADFIERENQGSCLINILTNNIVNKWSSISFIPVKDRIINEFTIINIINFYTSYKNIKVYNRDLYIKVENSILSVRKLFKIEDIINNFEIIFMDLYKDFEIQLKHLNIYDLKIKYFNKINNNFEKYNKNLINITKIDMSVLEFVDGIYITSINKFIKKEKLNITKMKNVFTTKYYNKKYRNLEKPKNWLKCLNKTIGDEKVVENFCKFFGSLFCFSNNFLGKKKTPYIWGPSNSGKTLLTVKILLNYFGIDNIGFLSKSKNFNLENIEGKDIAVFDEFDSNNINRDEFLKLLEGNPTLIDKKYKVARIQEAIKLILIANNKIEGKNKNDIAIENRVEYFEFKNSTKIEYEYSLTLKKLINEEANIITYCVKSYHKENKGFRKNIKLLISNDKNLPRIN